MRLSMFVAGFRLIASFLLVTSLGLGGVQAAPKAGPSDGPAIWKIDNGKSKGQVYLFGSVHMMKKGVVWYTPKIEGALLKSTDVVLEAKIDAAAMQEITKFIMQEGVYPAGDGLKNHINGALFEATVNLGKNVGLTEDTLNRLKPWYAATVLSLSTVQAQGYGAATGVETLIQDVAAKKGLPVTGLETINEQLQALSGNAPEVQEAMLQDSVDELKDITTMLNTLTTAWVSGDTDQLDKTLVQPMRKIPAAYEALLVKRNRNWIPKITALMATPGTHFVVVGAAHLVGRDGLVMMLQAKGIKANRL